jgi:Cof subfamily protein (haloacid dehalogenase superfamily)
MTGIRLVTIDLDGTLLDSRQQVSARNLAALQRLLDARVIVALATARDRASIVGRIPLVMPGLYYIASGGAMVYEPAHDAISWAEMLPPALAADAVAFLRRFNQPVFVNFDCDYWVDRDDDRVAMIERRYDLQARHFPRLEEVPLPVMRASLAAPRLVLERAAREAIVAFGDRASVSLASPDWLDVLGPGAGKGPALAWLQAQVGVSRAQTLAIGDYDSDLPLFAAAGYRVAMANGVAAIQAASTHRTASNDEDGVATALEMFFPA